MERRNGAPESGEEGTPLQDVASRNPSKQEPGYIYLLKPDNMPYKIGLTIDVDARVRQIGPVLPYRPVVVHTIRTNDTQRAEAHFHEAFAHRRLNGEWFDLSPEDVLAIQAVSQWHVETVVQRVLIVERAGAEPYEITVSAEWMTTREAGERLGVNDSRVRQFIRDGRLRSKKRGHLNFIHQQDVEALVQDLSTTTRRGPKARVAKQAEE